MQNLNEFEKKKVHFDSSLRATYIIMPLIYTGSKDIREITINGAEEIRFDSESMSDLIRHRCERKQGFVRRLRLETAGLQADLVDSEPLKIENIQLTVFDNGVAFLLLFFHVTDEKIENIYRFINPGYITDDDKDIQQYFIDDIRRNVLNGTGFDIYVAGDDKTLALKESYLLNAAFTNCRYDDHKTLERVSFNAHKLIRLGEDFEDISETDIEYTYGARDVQNRTFRWGCCISSQSISFVYGPSNADYDRERELRKKPVCDMTVNEMLEITEDDLLVTLLALYQKYTCMVLNEKIYIHMREHKGSRKTIQKIKKEALAFKAYGTIPPSQISRWNNVCETYAYLLKTNGIYDALGEISDNIALINEEKERIAAERQGYFATILAVFGLTSIIASVLQIVDYVGAGEPAMLLWLGISSMGVLLFGIAWILMLWKNKD